MNLAGTGQETDFIGRSRALVAVIRIHACHFQQSGGRDSDLRLNGWTLVDPHAWWWILAGGLASGPYTLFIHRVLYTSHALLFLMTG